MSRCLVSVAALAAMTVVAYAQDQEEVRDGFFYLSEMNKAAIVMLVEEGIVEPDLGTTIAGAVAQVIEDESQPGATRSSDYLANEALMIEIGGPDVSRIHSGRSRQDILATSTRLFQRAAALDAFEELNATRAFLLDLAAEYPDAVLPAYTWGVQAQPTTFGHYLLAFNETFERDAQRLREAWPRLNASPLGSAVIGTSSFPINRERLAELLGFDHVLENSYGSVQIAPIDTGVELASISASSALIAGNLIADITAQYHQANPWLVMTADAVGGSSIMPQKQNPTSLVNLRAHASRMVGDAVQFMFLAHNVQPGMSDYKRSEPEQLLHETATLFRTLRETLGNFTFNPERALEEVANEYSTTTELADVLQRDAEVPFRVGHHFASEIVGYGRANGLAPFELPFDEVQRIYAEVAAEYDLPDTELPLSEEEFQRSLSPENMVTAALGIGGTQPAEVERMLERQRSQLDADAAWLEDQRAALAEAEEQLDAAFLELAGQ